MNTRLTASDADAGFESREPRSEDLRHEAHVWLLRTADHDAPEVLARYRSLLDEKEKQRHERYRRDESRVAFAIAHGALRLTLSRYTDVDPQDWTFSIGEHGRPEIDTPTPWRGLRFNLSHTRGMVALVVTAGIDCGIDVEDTGGVDDLATLAERVLSVRELDNLKSRAEADRRRRFYEFWTLKESYIKARGLGLLLPLRDFAFEISEDGAIAIQFAATIDDDPSRWQFDCRRPTAQHQLAFALRSGGEEPLHVQVRSVAAPALCYQSVGR